MERNDKLVLSRARKLRVDPNDVITLERDVREDAVHRDGKSDALRGQVRPRHWNNVIFLGLCV